MVYFVCSTCGTSLKKNQVTTHWFKCRQGKNVSCMDCGKDFWGEDYASHVKCITEDQKYGGSNYVSKENKGEKKQEEWVMKIKEKVASSQNMEPQLKELLQNIVYHSNIPRKEVKFRNFMRSSCRVSNTKLVDKVWQIFKDANAKSDTNTNSNGVKNGLNVTEANNSDKKSNGENVPEAPTEGDTNCSNGTMKLNKREKKELRKEKQSKKSKKDKHTIQDNNTDSGTKRKLDNEEEETNVETAEPKKKKKKKRKGDDSLVEEEQVVETNEPKKKKKKKGNDSLEESIVSNENHVKEEKSEEEAHPQPQPTSTFKWSVAIKRVLQDGPEEGVKVSKMQRKVFSLYYAAHGEGSHVKSKAELISLLHKKLNKRNQFIMFKDKVKLRK